MEFYSKSPNTLDNYKKAPETPVLSEPELTDEQISKLLKHVNHSSTSLKMAVNDRELIKLMKDTI